ncbi:DUF2855 family protein [Kordiimonas marina]|uniref:DUF2855 family protein n=1 Tax=Kordiimonas marina TaxID=2872312 RepID=UPI001FF174FD|nr:DUF2855 family protein [Kordiimonas marina]MCJ9427834.1 DUF2855 family protein [Kordiimonas marina]
MSSTITRTDFLVRRDALHETSFWEVPVEPAALKDGEVILKVDSVAFTANNVTYAAFGEAMHYWDFFPAHDGWGRVPVWGFGDVVASKCAGVKVGERFYGYYPMSSHLTVSPVKCSPAGFMDGAAHRRELSPIYNTYVRTTTDPGYSADGEDLQMIFRPLFMTSFLIDDFLDDNDYFGAAQLVLSSASSKTAFGVAFLAAKREGVKVIGLTSPGNVGFCEKLGCYDEIVAYDKIQSLDAGTPTVYVDMAGSGPVRRAVHSHFADNLKFSSSVGASHWDDMGSNKDLKGPRPTLFFAPAQGQKRAKEWGNDKLQAKSAAAWAAFISQAKDWITVEHHTGRNEMEAVYRATLDGKVKPSIGHILSF